MKEYKYKINGTEYKVAVGELVDDTVTVEVNGAPYKVELEKKPASVPVSKPKPAKVAVPTPKPTAAAAPAAGGNAIKSPLPGVVLDIKVAVGDTVAVGDKVIVLEAMKMENDINAQSAGTVTAINVSKGDSVQEGQALITLG